MELPRVEWALTHMYSTPHRNTHTHAPTQKTHTHAPSQAETCFKLYFLPGSWSKSRQKPADHVSLLCCWVSLLSHIQLYSEAARWGCMYETLWMSVCLLSSSDLPELFIGGAPYATIFSGATSSLVKSMHWHTAERPSAELAASVLQRSQNLSCRRQHTAWEESAEQVEHWLVLSPRTRFISGSSLIDVVRLHQFYKIDKGLLSKMDMNRILKDFRPEKMNKNPVRNL